MIGIRILLKGVFSFKLFWQIWIGCLVLTNGILPLFFIQTLEAKIVLLSLLIAGVIQVGIASWLGFVRLLGLGHILTWTPLIWFLCTRMSNLTEATHTWVFALVLINSISLVIDVVDVTRFMLGDRTPTVTARDL